MDVNVDNIDQNNFHNICRTCLNMCDVKFFGDHVISNVFYKLTDIHFKTNDDIPQQICLKCFEKINEIHEFAFQCKRSHSTLTNRLNTGVSEEQDVVESPDDDERHEFIIKLGGKIAIHKEKTKIIEDKNFKPTNNDINDELTTENILEFTSCEYNGNIIAEASERNEVSSFEDSVCKSNNVSNNDVNWSDSNEKTYSSDGSADLIIDSMKNSEKESNESKYKCENCNRSFIYLKAFEKHINSSSSMCANICKHCSKSFNKLKAHMRTHSGERPYKCAQCSKSFAQLSSMKNHMRTHSGERPFKCEQCSKSFTRLFSMKVHMRTHCRERPYKFDQCSKSFTQSITLKNHKQLYSGECPYKCDHCSKSYKYLQQLKEHLRTHNF